MKKRKQILKMLARRLVRTGLKTVRPVIQDIAGSLAPILFLPGAVLLFLLAFNAPLAQTISIQAVGVTLNISATWPFGVALLTIGFGLYFFKHGLK